MLFVQFLYSVCNGKRAGVYCDLQYIIHTGGDAGRNRTGECSDRILFCAACFSVTQVAAQQNGAVCDGGYRLLLYRRWNSRIPAGLGNKTGCGDGVVFAGTVLFDYGS